MSNRASILLLVLVMGLLLPTAVSRALLTLSSAEGVGVDTAVAPNNDPIPQGAELIANWYNQGDQFMRKGAGIISYYNLAVFGQNTCTAFGDPYSPLNSPWAPGTYTYTYHYRIRIPADYKQRAGTAVLRVELFDPDSINVNASGPFNFTRSQAAQDAGLPATGSGTCQMTNNRKNPCLAATGKLALYQNGTLPLEAINPYWFIRVDENRGLVTPGQCGEPSSYIAAYNLNVTTVSGASENAFEIWAAPPSYVSTVPGSVNARNLHTLNNPGSHHAKGVTVQAIQNLPLNSNFPFPLDIPLTYVGPEHAGQEITVSLFDYDQNDTPPPVTFFFDSMGISDWSLTFGMPGVPDPDGQVRNCTPSLTCNNVWVMPPYSITVPGGDPAACDYSNPQNDPNCIPFPGGRLMARVTVGYMDTYQWEVKPPTLTPTVDPAVGCAAFPMTIHEGARSVTQAYYETITGSPNFYPNPALPYSSFFDHRPDIPLPDAQQGDLFLMENDAGGFGWLKWNQYVPSDAAVLEHGLIWPGDSKDYVTVAPGPPPDPPFPYPVYGYIDYNDPFDTSMNLGDWVMAHTGAANSAAVLDRLEGHIDWGRVLRLPIYQNFAGTGSNARYQMSGFALFRVAGYLLSANGQEGSYLLLEFIRWDDSCGQVNVPLSTVDIHGPAIGYASTDYAFTAVPTPFYATTPITYVWQADGHLPITYTGGISDVINLSWPLTGTYGLTVTAVNPLGGPVTAVHSILIEQLQPDLTVIGAPQLVTPLPVGAGLLVSFTVTIANVGDADVDTPFFVDVFIDPTVVLTTGIPISESSGFTAVPALAMGESVTLTLNAPFGFPELPPTHTVYAMVDSVQTIAESDETNNVSAPLTVTDVRPLLAGVTIFGPALGLTGETYTFTAVVTPTTITDPITYTWYLGDTPTLTITNDTAVPITLTFPVTGTFDLLVMASHGFNTVTDTHTILITDTLITDLAVIGTPQLFTPGLVSPEQPVSFTVTIQNVGNVPLTGPIQTDIFLHPAIVLSDSIPITQSNGFAMIAGLGVGETAVFTFTIPAGFGPGPLYRQVYAMVDSLQTIAEADESNNVSLPRQVVVGWPSYLPVVMK
ncbi:MAG: hypothetical protein HND44_16140 [Chloroflexi bacterium]|nr:hypothetical protein [Ardenticatenaceae bacterium]MBL1129991.1 hypothetical protein [Chloroflexota bacterium]NOG36077.1 hypothetical protein [Chloroflexota bacterium]GIK58995.1 MAG: hypothetical protein BroJett015_46580 [Chloroflexota bacterium]